MIVRYTKLYETPHGGDDLGENLERILPDVEITQALEAAERIWKLRQLDVMQVQEVAQRLKAAEANRQLTQPVMAEVEHAKFAEIPDTFRNLGQLVAGQHERLQLAHEAR